MLLYQKMEWGEEEAACSIQAGGSPLKVVREGGPFRGDTFIK